MRTAREQPIRIVRKSRKKHAHHGGAWKVAFADFMTAMMALFLVLWLVTQSSQVRASIAGYFQDPLGRSHETGNSLMPGNGAPLTQTRPSVQAEPADGKHDKILQLAQQIEASLPSDSTGDTKDNHVVVEVTQDGLRISLIEDSSDVFFKSGSSRPLPHGDSLFRAIGAVLGHAAAPIDVEGHTDARPYGPGRSYGNWELSTDRANVARRLLIEGGLAESQVRAVRGLADRALSVPADPFAPQNRRVTILVALPHDAPAAASAAGTP